MNKKLYIFDFDGTIGDTQECIVASYQQAMAENNLPAPDREKIIHLMGIPLQVTLHKLTDNKLSEAEYDTLIHSYRKHYKENLSTKTLIFPGTKETLTALHEQGKLLSIATSKKTEFAKLSCEHLSIDKLFSLYVGEDLVTSKKPHPEMLELTLNHFKLRKEDAVMVGDSTFDIDMGTAMGMDTIAVTWGAHSLEELKQSHPTYLIDSFPDILRLS